MGIREDNFILPKLIISCRHFDDRGFFAEIYSKKKYIAEGIDIDFVQDNHSLSLKAGTVRGLHFQKSPKAQAKLVRCVRGAIFDVAVDIRHGSPTYGKWEAHELTAKNGYQFYIPAGYAHGFLTLEPESEIIYKCSDYYSPETEGALFWNDPDIGINWPFNGEPNISSKDSSAPLLKDLRNKFVYGVNS